MSSTIYEPSVWSLTGCCGVEEQIFLALYFVYGIIIHCFFKYEIFYPFKLLAVFVHEMSHGSAAWLTCGKVKSIVVNLDQSGTASYTGGMQWMIIPAGYVGGAFWGGAFVALSGSRIVPLWRRALFPWRYSLLWRKYPCILANMFFFLLADSVISSRFSFFANSHNPNKVVVFISVGFSIFTIAAILIDWFVIDPFLQYFTLFYGVFFGYYAIRDTYDDTYVIISI